jgi:hypothetical protein
MPVVAVVAHLPQGSKWDRRRTMLPAVTAALVAAFSVPHTRAAAVAVTLPIQLVAQAAAVAAVVVQAARVPRQQRVAP